jgi:hypothetical protein
MGEMVARLGIEPSPEAYEAPELPVLHLATSGLCGDPFRPPRTLAPSRHPQAHEQGSPVVYR